MVATDKPTETAADPSITGALAKQPAIPPAQEAPEAKATFAVKVYAVSPDGFVVEIQSSENERPFSAIGAMCSNLARQHFTPIDPYAPATVDVDVAAPSPAAASGGAAAAAGGAPVLIPSEGGKPPRCSQHGALKWVEGDYKAGHARAGQHYEFWGCVQGCKVRAGSSGAAN